MKRDLYIDFAKGIATLCIVFIHTAFWSGQFYIPTEVRVLSLLFDVPIFFALSGLTSGNNVEKTFYRLLKLQITFMIFATALFFADYFFKLGGVSLVGEQKMLDFYKIFGRKYAPVSVSLFPQWQNLGNWYLHEYTNADTFPVVMGSFWYLKVYYILTVFGVLLLRFFPKHIPWFIVLCFGLTIFFNTNLKYYPSGQVGYVAFYLGLFLLATRLKNKILPTKIAITSYVIFGILLMALCFYFAGNLYSENYNPFILFDNFLLKSGMNKAKFPPKLLYIFWACLSLITLFSFYNRMKITRQNLVTRIGKDAIFYYFAQGISSSLIYLPVVALKDEMPWYVLMVLMYIVNVTLAIAFAQILKKLDAFGWKLLQYLRIKTAI